MKIGLSDLAGLNSLEEPEEIVENINEVMLRRNRGVSDHHYSSNRDLNALNRLKNGEDRIPDRTYSASAAFCSPIINVRHDVIDITLFDVDSEKENQPQRDDEPTKTADTTTKEIETIPAKPKPTIAPKPKSMKQRVSPNSSPNKVQTIDQENRTSSGVDSNNTSTAKPTVERSVSHEPNKKIQLPASNMFYAPATLPKATTVTKRQVSSRSHLEQIGERHLSRQKSASLQSLPDRQISRTFSQPTVGGMERPPQRCNSSTVTTRFDGNVWDVSLCKREPLTGKSTRV